MQRRARFAAVPVALIVAAVTIAIVAASGSTATKVGTGSDAAGKCGLGNGKKASGAPIKLGGIGMLIPGVDFTTIGKVAKAYFDCVNDNGGIRGRPIRYTLYTEQLNPAQEAALARKLIGSDRVVGIVGNTSFAECGTNWKYYKSKGYVVIGAGVQAECYSTPSFAEVEHRARATATSAPRRRSSRRASRSSRSPHRTRSPPTRTAARRSWRLQPAFRSRSSRPTCRSRTRPRSCSRCTSSPATAAAS